MSKYKAIKLSLLPDKLLQDMRHSNPNGALPALQEAYSNIVTYSYKHFLNTKKYKQQIVNALNYATYCFVFNNSPDISWRIADPVSTTPEFDTVDVEATLKDFYLSISSITWDIEPTEDISDATVTAAEKATKQPARVAPKVVKPVVASKPTVNMQAVSELRANAPTRTAEVQKPTPKQDLYIQPPMYPQFDVNKIWMQGQDGPTRLVIYTTLPEIPTKQNEISVTTNIDMMRDEEKLALFPNVLIKTRAPIMYEPQEGLEFDEKLGIILPIEGFTKEQVKQNILEYPHLFKLQREYNNDLVSMYSTIEIDGELKNISDVWNTLPESKVIPAQSEFIKEYTVRRYLLERDIKGIKHNYPLYGSLDPYLTLFMPASDYAAYGQTDALELANKCILSRVRYKQTRNPIIRRLQQL